jgi:hypothetical protein
MVMMPIALGAALAATRPADKAELTEANFERLLKFVLPTEQECRWQQIPWRETYWEAVHEANRADKPILLWAMNGHPLGCT